METPDKEENTQLPGDHPADETGHSEGFYETHEKPASDEAFSPDHATKPGASDTAADSDHTTGQTDERAEEKLKQKIRSKTVVAFTVFGVMFILFIGAFAWVIHQRDDNGVPHPFRTILSANEKVNKAFYKESHLAPTYPQSAAEKKPKVNGDVGMDTHFKLADWVLKIVNVDRHDTMIFNMDSIRKLPKTEICFNFKCIEGWSQVTHWGGVRLIDFINHYRLATHSGKPIDPDHLEDLARYAGFQTPDKQYYVGLDIASALHPQTLLCYEMNGKPLPYDQGAPLRLIVPVKYGIKSLKRIGLIYFSDKRPADYWFEQGYDYDAAL